MARIADKVEELLTADWCAALPVIFGRPSAEDIFEARVRHGRGVRDQRKMPQGLHGISTIETRFPDKLLRILRSRSVVEVVIRRGGKSVDSIHLVKVIVNLLVSHKTSYWGADGPRLESMVS